jgi:peptide/nickel transport system permease protein
LLQYTIRRILLIIPTFFLISMLIFLVLNLAPGRPGAAGNDGGEAQGQEQQESYRIFKEQFNLDKPIVLNLRHRVRADEVRAWLVSARGLEGEPSAADRIAAQDRLDDYGEVLVQHLIPLLDDPDPRVQRAAAQTLTGAAQARFVNDRRGDVVAARQANRLISNENQKIKAWRWAEEAPEAEQQAAKQQWSAWYAERSEQFTYTAAEAAAMTVLDTRFAKYWQNLLLLDFGVSNVDRRPVFDTLVSKLRYSLSLSTLAVVLAYLLAVPLGIFSAVRQGTRADLAVTVGLFVLYSLPSFFVGTVLLRVFTEGSPWSLFPTGDFETMAAGPMTTAQHVKDVAWHLVLPVVTYTSGALAALSRYARTGVIDVIRADYIRTARAKGLSEPVVIIKHAVRNGMIPILTLLGGLLPTLVAGSTVIEVIFNIPGMGQYLFHSINLRDYNAVMAVLLASSVLSLVGILLSDLSYALVDPRISLD